MPDVHFEIIRLEDIGKDILKSSSKKSTPRSAHKLTDADVQNLKHYLHRYNQPSAKTTTTATANRRKSVDDMAASQHREHVKVIDSVHIDKFASQADDLSEFSQPLTDIYRYHHHYRRHHQQTRHAHDKPTILPVSLDGYEVFCLDFATCGMKKNTRLPVPHENFSLLNGCFGDDAGFTTRQQQQNFLGMTCRSSQLSTLSALQRYIRRCRWESDVRLRSSAVLGILDAQLFRSRAHRKVSDARAQASPLPCLRSRSNRELFRYAGRFTCESHSIFFLRRQRHRVCGGRRLPHGTTSFGQHRRLRLCGRSRRPSRLPIAIAEDEWRLSETIGCVPVDSSVEVKGPQLHADIVGAVFFLIVRGAKACSSRIESIHSLVLHCQGVIDL